MSAVGQTRSFGDVGCMSGLPETADTAGRFMSTRPRACTHQRQICGPLSGVNRRTSARSEPFRVSPVADIGKAESRAEYRHETLDHSGVIPANLITLPHFSVSSAINLAKSAGEPARPVPPRSASLVLILGSARAALTSLLSLSIISTGVRLGAPTPT